MKQIMAGLALAFVVTGVGCGGSQKKATTPAGPTCADVAANTEKQLVEAGQKGGMDMAEMAAMAREVINERCPADGWSADAIACLATATGEQMETCSKKLTPEQNQKLEESMKLRLHDLDGAMKEEAPAGAAPPDDPCGGDE